jgi:DnaA family protein
MALYNTLGDGDGSVSRRLMVAHRQPAAAVSFSLADLNSRLRALAHHQLAPLDDDDKSQVLRIRAEQRGYHLSDSVVEYWLRRGPRGVDQLLADLERLDAATLQHKRLLTVPLLKSVLGY